MKNFDVSVIGELNVDLILNRIDSFPAVGKEILSREMNLTLGSSSAIFASNLSSLGAKVAFIGKTGRDHFGNVIMESLHQNGVDTSGILRDAALKTGATVVLNFGEERAMVTHPGAMEGLQYQDIDWDLVAQSRHLHISSFFIQKGLRQDVGRIFQKARQLGLTTSLDPQWDPAEQWDFDLEGILPYVDVFLPNHKEVLHMTRQRDLNAALDRLADCTNTVIVKMGSEGSLLFQNGQITRLGAFLNEEVVDAIGAGDSFNAGFVFKYIQNEPVLSCQEFGNMVGAYSTTAAGGTGAFVPGKDNLENVKEKFGYVEK